MTVMPTAARVVALEKRRDELVLEGECRSARGDHDGAIESFRRAVACEREVSRVLERADREGRL